MPSLHFQKNNFSSGETNHTLDGRTDSNVVNNGCRVLENFIIRPFGGVARRPGTEYIGRAESDSCRLIPFKSSANENYALEFSPGDIKIWSGGDNPETVSILQSEISVFESERGYNTNEYIRIPYPAGISPSLSSFSPHTVLRCLASYSDENWDSSSNNPISALLNNDFSVWQNISFTSDPIHFETAKPPFFRLSDSVLADDLRIELNYNYYIKSDPLVQEGKIVFWVNPTLTGAPYQNPTAEDEINNQPFPTFVLNNDSTALPDIFDRISTLSADPLWGGLSSTFVDSSTLDIFSNITPKDKNLVSTYIPGNPLTELFNAVNIEVRLDQYSFDGDLLTWSSSNITPTPELLSVRGIPYSIFSPYNNCNDIKNLQYVQLNDIMFLVSNNVFPYRLSKFSEKNWIIEKIPFEYAPVLDINEDLTEVSINYNYPDWSAQTWLVANEYLVGDIVVEDSTPFEFYVCIAEHTSSAGNEAGTGGGSSFWTKKTYSKGDRVVNDNGILYTCRTNHTPRVSTSSPLGQPGFSTGSWTDNWNEGTRSNAIPQWNHPRVYRVGNLVRVGGVVYECTVRHRTVAQSLLSIFDGTLETLNNAGNKPGIGKNWTSYWKINGGMNDLGDVECELRSSNSLFSSGDEDSTVLLKLGVNNYYIEQKLGTLSNDAEFGPSNSIFLQGAYLISSNWNAGSALIGSIILEESLDGIIWSPRKEWITTANTDGNISFSGEAPTLGAWYRFRGYKKSGGNKSIKIEPVSSILNIPFKITLVENDKKAIGKVTLPNNQLPPPQAVGTGTKLFYRGAFSENNGYPSTVAFFENRLWFGGTKNDRTRLWASNVDDFYNFLIGTDDSSALDVSLASTETNKINWIKPFNKTLVIATEGEVWTIDSGENDGPLTPTSLRARTRLKLGSNYVPPILTGESLLWLQRGGEALREFAYRFENDQFSGPEMSLFSSHLFKGGVHSASFQNNPEPIWWGINNNGELLSMSYNREQEIVGWGRHRFGLRDDYFPDQSGTNVPDKFLDVIVLYGNSNVDEVWFLTERIKGNESVRNIERFHRDTLKFVLGENPNENSNYCFVDCATYSISNPSLSAGNMIFLPGSSTFDNLRALKNVQVCGNKFSYTDVNLATSINGETISIPATSITVPITTNSGVLTSNSFGYFIGSPYVSILMPNNFDIPLQNGTSIGRKKRINRVMYNLYNSIGGEYFLLNGELDNPSDSEIQDFEFKPLWNDSYNNIDYRGMTFSNFSYPVRNLPLLPYRPKSGLTDDQNVVGDFSHSLLYGIVQRSPAPFTILNQTSKIEINGN
jgi:hypothetical protein